MLFYCYYYIIVFIFLSCIDSLVPKSDLPQLSDLYLLDAIIAKIRILMDDGVSKPATESAESAK